MKIGKKFKILLLVGLLVASLPVTTLAKAPEKKVIDYVALGDSLAAGYTPYGPGELGYPEYLAIRFEQSQYTVGFENFGVPGYRTEDILKDFKINRENVLGEISEAEYITIDIGGNDLLAVIRDPKAGPIEIQKAMADATGNIYAILKTIDTLNPDVKVYVMGYYNVLPYLPANQQQFLLPILETFNTLIENTAIANGDTFVPTAKIIAKDYQTYLPNPKDIHLSLEGYQIVAKEFWKYIDKSKND